MDHKENKWKFNTDQMKLRLDENLINECEELAEKQNLDRSSLIKKVLIEGL